MIEDVYNPVQKFRSEFRDKFKEVAEQTFEDLLKHSGLDVEANKEIVNKINDRVIEEKGEIQNYLTGVLVRLLDNKIELGLLFFIIHL